MDTDFIELATFINMWELHDKEHQERSRAEFRQFMVTMVDKGPEHLVRIFKMYLKGAGSELVEDTIEGFT
jgi:hypothetical protein